MQEEQIHRKRTQSQASSSLFPLPPTILSLPASPSPSPPRGTSLRGARTPDCDVRASPVTCIAVRPANSDVALVSFPTLLLRRWMLKMSDVLMPADSLSPRESTNQDVVQVKQSSGIKSVVTKSDIATCGSLSEIMQEDVLPLTGDPFFTCILMKSNVQGPFQLVIPRSFSCNLPAENVTITLCCRNRTWEIGYIGTSNVKRFDAKWREFAMDNKLKIGDAAVFELTDCSSLKFRVQILDGSLPEPFRSESKGINSNTPILLDDD